MLQKLIAASESDMTSRVFVSRPAWGPHAVRQRHPSSKSAHVCRHVTTLLHPRWISEVETCSLAAGRVSADFAVRCFRSRARAGISSEGMSCLRRDAHRFRLSRGRVAFAKGGRAGDSRDTVLVCVCTERGGERGRDGERGGESGREGERWERRH